MPGVKPFLQEKEGKTAGKAKAAPVDAGLKPITFHPKSGRLVPIGKLTLLESEATYRDGLGVFIKCVWIDEAGLKWPINYNTSDWDLTPAEWPRNIRAKYVIQYNRGCTTPVVANSYEEALAELRSQGRFLDAVTLRSVSAPND